MTAPGDLCRRLVLQAPIETPDGAGGVTRSYHDVAPLWAEVTPLSARGAFVAGVYAATVTHRIVVRSGPEITTAHRLRDGPRVFTIVALREADATRRYVSIEAQERAG